MPPQAKDICPAIMTTTNTSSTTTTTSSSSSSSPPSSWPWMKGIQEAIVSIPIDPVVPDDVRPSVHDLIMEHRSTIDQVKKELIVSDEYPLYDSTKHDDLWIVRFILSHTNKHLPTIMKAIQTTFEYRSKYNLDIKDLRDSPPHQLQTKIVTLETEPTEVTTSRNNANNNNEKNDNEEDDNNNKDDNGNDVNNSNNVISKDITTNEALRIAHKYWTTRCPNDALVATLPNMQRGIIHIARQGGFHNKKALDELSYEEWELAHVYSTEYCFQTLDYITRTTGRLTQMIRIIMIGANLMKVGAWQDAMKRDGSIMNSVKDCYPQLLDSIQVFNCNPAMQKVWMVARSMLPGRVVSKVKAIAKRTTYSTRPKIVSTPIPNEGEETKAEEEVKEEENEDVKNLLKYISKDDLPVMFGGTNTQSPLEW